MTSLDHNGFDGADYRAMWQTAQEALLEANRRVVALEGALRSCPSLAGTTDELVESWLRWWNGEVLPVLNGGR